MKLHQYFVSLHIYLYNLQVEETVTAVSRYMSVRAYARARSSIFDRQSVRVRGVISGQSTYVRRSTARVTGFMLVSL